MIVAACLVLLIATGSVFVYSKQQAAPPVEIKFYVPKPNDGALMQSAVLSANADQASAALIQKMVQIPHAVWLTGRQA